MDLNVLFCEKQVVRNVLVTLHIFIDVLIGVTVVVSGGGGGDTDVVAVVVVSGGGGGGGIRRL